MIGIICALPQEARALTQKTLQQKTPLLVQNLGWICLSGMGEHHAFQAAQALLNQDIRGLLSFGLAGGLDPGLSCGDVILPKQIISSDGEEYCVDIPWHQQIYQNLSADFKVHEGKSLEVGSIITTVEEKKSLYKKTGAIALDMESAAIARVARNQNKPFLVARVIFDDAHTVLPSFILNATTTEGNLAWLNLLPSLIKHPTQISALLSLALAFNKASYILKKLGEKLKVANLG